jgi:hypothetical protein
MLKPFEAGKNAKELGIDTSKKFVVVNNRDTFPNTKKSRNNTDSTKKDTVYKVIWTTKWTTKMNFMCVLII